MPKMKTHKGILRRGKVTARGKVVFKAPNMNHLMSGKSGKRCRKLRRPTVLNRVYGQRLLNAVGMGRKARRRRAEATTKAKETT